MRIVQVAQFYLPWLGYQEFYLSRELARLGHEVLVVASDLRWSPDELSRAHASGQHRMPAGETVDDGFRCLRLRSVATVRGRLLLRGVGAAIRSFQPDAVHAHGYLLPLTAQAASATDRRTSRFVVDEHQLAYQAKTGSLHRAQRRFASALARQWLLPRIDALVPVADGAREWLINGYGCPPAAIGATIPLGADPDVFRPDDELRARGRAELGVSADEIVVLSSGKIAPHKRLDLLIAAAQRVSDPRVVVVLIGNAVAETARDLEAQAREAGVRLRIAAAVPTTELPRFFNAADICAWPADCTISHLEAASCGRAIIVPDEDAIADRIDAGNGLAAHTGDVDALAAALRRLCQDDQLRRSMGARGRAIVERRYAWRRIAERWLEVYAGG